MLAFCEHSVVERHESHNPRLPMIVWRCRECGKMFEPKGNLRRRFTVWREARRFRRALGKL